MSVIIPKQSVPPLDGLFDSQGNPVLFNKTWWLAFSSIGDVVNTPPSQSPATSSVATIERFPLTAATVVTPVTIATVGAVLVVKLTQDATGGWTITWATNVKGAPTNIDPTALSVSWFTFVGDTDPADSVVKWFSTERPVTGQAP